MSTLNASIPRIDGFIRKEFLYNLTAHVGEFEAATIFGVASVAGRALGFHALVHATGAVIWRLPIHALTTRVGAPAMALHDLQLWDCLSYEIGVTEFDYLSEMRCLVYLGAGAYPGSYLFTVDWFGNVDSEEAGSSGHKCAHVIQLDNGCLAAQPNNRLAWHEPAQVTLDSRGVQAKPDYTIMQHTWKCEDGAWETASGDRMFYEVQPARRPSHDE